MDNTNYGSEINSMAAAVSAAMSGNNDGFTYLYNNTYSNSYYTAVKYMKNEDAAADVVQEAYMRAFQNISMLQDTNKFTGWLSMIVANTAKNHLRKNNPVLFTEIDIDNGEDSAIEFQDTIVDEKTDFRPEEHYSKVEISELVDELLNALPEEQKICMILYYLEGLSVEEIAASLECSKNTVTSRLNYGRKKIKARGEELEKRGYKLYSVSPVIFLALLLRSEAGSISVSTATAGGDTVANINVGSTLGQVTTKAPESSAAKAGFLSTTAGKIVAAFAGLAIIGGITVGIILATSEKDKKDSDVAGNVTTEVFGGLTTEAPTEVTSEKKTETPDDIITEDTTAEDTTTEDTTTKDKTTEDTTAENVTEMEVDTEEIHDVLGYNLGYRSTRYGAEFIILSDDGTFTITYTDHEPYAGDVEGGAIGTYSDIQQIDEYSYSFKVTGASDMYVAHTEEVEVQDPNIVGGSYIYRHEFVELASEAEGEYIIYLPGTPRSMIPENVEIGATGAYPTEGIVDKETNEITDYVIYKKGANFAYFIDR